MVEKFQKLYRIPSARLQNWDYSQQASYFVTICTQHKEHYFGEVVNGLMQLSVIGKIVEAEWLNTPTIRPDMNLGPGAFVVMPNHFHAIITIGENAYNTQHPTRRDAVPASHPVPASPSVCPTPTFPAAPAVAATSSEPVSPSSPDYKNSFASQSKNLAAVVAGFKAAVTRQARQLHADFAWQTRYHDHLIRDASAYQLIENYIINNPLTWQEDKFF